MATICKDLDLPCDPATAWDAVRDFGAVHERVARGFVTDTRPEGGDRVVTFFDGVTVRERLVAVDDDRRRLVYAVVDSALPLQHHQASVEVVDGAGGGTRFVWTTDVLPDDAAPVLEKYMDLGAEAVARTLSA